MYAVINRLQSPAAHAEQLEVAFRHASNMDGVPGFKAFHFLKNVRAGETIEYLVLTYWESSEAWQAWTRTESFRRAHSGMAAHGEITATQDTYEVLIS